MDGIHDLGGKQGFGAVQREADEPVFHERWEARVLGIRLLGDGGTALNIDHFRHGIERIDPVAYLTHGYYGRWLGGLETRLVEAGVLDTATITRRAIEIGASANDLIAARPMADPDRVDYRPAASGNQRAIPGVRRRDLQWVRACALRRTACRVIPGCRRMRAIALGRSLRGVAAGCSRTPTRTVTARIPNTCTQSHFRARNCGARGRSPASSCISTCSSRTWMPRLMLTEGVRMTDSRAPAIRAEAIESLLIEKGLITAAAVDEVVERYNDRVGPLNGARVVARAWCDAGFKQALLADGTAAVATFAFDGGQTEKLVVVENTANVHNVVVCTLCSCYPWAILGLPPRWYKDPAYRSRIVREPRRVLEEFGVRLDADVEIRVWDSSAEVRYLVLPQRPAGTDGATEAELVGRVTRDAMIGVEVLR